jgi:hypothetical protein
MIRSAQYKERVYAALPDGEVIPFGPRAAVIRDGDRYLFIRWGEQDEPHVAVCENGHVRICEQPPTLPYWYTFAEGVTEEQRAAFRDGMTFLAADNWARQVQRISNSVNASLPRGVVYPETGSQLSEDPQYE